MPSLLRLAGLYILHARGRSEIDAGGCASTAAAGDAGRGAGVEVEWESRGAPTARVAAGAQAKAYALRAIRADSDCFRAWELLGEAESLLGQPERAAQAFIAALELEAAAPAFPFTAIPFLL